MGHSVKLDDVYYDKDNAKSQQKILLEYMKAINALTINDEYRLKKKIAVYEEKLKMYLRWNNWNRILLTKSLNKKP